MKRKFFYYHHQDKGKKFLSSLSQGEWDRVPNLSLAGIIFSDLENWGRSKFLEEAHLRVGSPTVLYPHGVHASCSWNFPGCKTFPFVKSVLVPAHGHTAVMRSYGNQYPTFVTGWTLSPVSPFAQTTGRSILFAPKHPNRNGYLSEVDRSSNARAFQLLTSVCRRGNHRLTVRLLGSPAANGVPHDASITYVEGAPSAEEAANFITDFDLIVGTQTLAFIAVAMGKPTIMFGEFIAPHYGGSDNRLTYVKDWDKYKHIMMYPLDLFAEEDTQFLIERTLYSDYEISDWKARMIGGPYDEAAFLNHVKEIYDQANETRPGRTESFTGSIDREFRKAQEERQRQSHPQHERVGAFQEGD